MNAVDRNFIAGQASSTQNQWIPPYYVRGLALGIPIYFLAIHMWTWILFVPGSLAQGGYDFRQSYTAAYMLRTGHGRELYDFESQRAFQNKVVSSEKTALPFVEPAYEAFFLEPLTLVPFRVAYFLFVAVNLTALWACFALLRPWMANLKAIFAWLPAVLFLGFLPVAAALIEGQDSILLTTCLVYAFVFLTRGKEVAAGVFTGLALFKFPIVLPIAALFMIWRRWRFLTGFATSAVALLSLSVWLTGIRETRLYVDALVQIAGLRPATSGLALYPVNWRMMANVHGFMAGIAGNLIPSLWVHGITILLSAAILTWTAVQGLRTYYSPLLLLLAVTCSVLVGHHTYIHDLSVLLLPMIVLLNNFLPAESLDRGGARWIARAAVLMFVATVVESFDPGMFYVVALAVLGLLIAVSYADNSKTLQKFPDSRERNPLARLQPDTPICVAHEGVTRA